MLIQKQVSEILEKKRGYSKYQRNYGTKKGADVIKFEPTTVGPLRMELQKHEDILGKTSKWTKSFVQNVCKAETTTVESLDQILPFPSTTFARASFKQDFLAKIPYASKSVDQYQEYQEKWKSIPISDKLSMDPNAMQIGDLLALYCERQLKNTDENVLCLQSCVLMYT